MGAPLMETALHQALYGTEVPEEPRVPMHCGPWRFERQGLILRDIHYQDRLAWSSLGFVCRDIHWGTPTPVIDEVDHATRTDGFTLTLRAHLAGPPRVGLEVTIAVDARSGVRYEARAQIAEVTKIADVSQSSGYASAALTNRAGLCLEHPLALAGQPVNIRHDDGRSTHSEFPARVPAWPPFTAVRAIAHSLTPEAWACCEFEGEYFETEDQRNNADASFKTYSRSNSMPRPYRLESGDQLWQRATLRIERGRTSSPTATTPPSPTPTASVEGGRSDAWRAPPVLGLGLAPEDLANLTQWAPALAQLRPARLHLVMDHAAEPLDTQALAQALATSGARLRLDLRGHSPAAIRQGPVMDADLASASAGTNSLAKTLDLGLTALAAALRAAGIAPQDVALFPGQAAELYALAHAFPGAARGAGTPYFFAQANRAERLGAADFVSFTTCSLVHGTEAAQVMDGLRSLPSLLQTLRARHGIAHIEVGPSGLAAPRSPLGQQPAPDRLRPQCLGQHDPRSAALFGAAWLVGHVAALMEAGAQAISLRGLGRDDGLLLPGEGVWRMSPAAHALQTLLAPATRVRAQAWRDGPWARIEHEGPKGRSLVLANLDPEPLPLRALLPPGAHSSRPETLDAAGWLDHRAGAASPWRELRGDQLGPYALIRAFP